MATGDATGDATGAFAPAHAACECDCRHLMRWLVRASRSGGGFRPVRLPARCLNPNRVPPTSRHEVRSFEVGPPDAWYHRCLYLVQRTVPSSDDDGSDDDGRDDGGSDPSAAADESFTHGLRCVYTTREAAALFHELRACRCCERHRAKRPGAFPAHHHLREGA